MTQSRQPAGIPVGGQFASGARARADMTLNDEAPGIERAAREAATDAVHRSLSDSFDIDSPLSAKDLLDDLAARGYQVTPLAETDTTSDADIAAEYPLGTKIRTHYSHEGNGAVAGYVGDALLVTMNDGSERRFKASEIIPADASPALRAIERTPAAGRVIVEDGVRTTIGLAKAHQPARERIRAELERAERIGAQLLSERVLALHPDAATVHLGITNVDMHYSLSVQAIRDADGNDISPSFYDRDIDDLNDFAADLEVLDSAVTTYDENEQLDVLDVRVRHLHEGDLP